MLNFMREGGYAMWLMLISVLAVAAYAFTRARERRAGILAVGTILLLLQGILGMATGMKAVAAYAAHPRFATLPDQAAHVAMGLGELANNGIFATACALLLGVGWLITRRPASAA